MKPLVYVAGPITKPDPMSNTHRAVKVASQLLASDIVPLVPHLTVLWDMIDPHDYEEWMAYDFDLIQHCDALYRIEGESAGADREVALALSLGLPVLTSIPEAHEWAAQWPTERVA